MLDQYLFDIDPYEANTMLDHAGTAIPIQVNLAICGMDRLAREVRGAVQRRQREEASARQAAIRKLYIGLNSTTTALLLSIELALQTEALPPSVIEKLASVLELVRTLRKQLESVGSAEETVPTVIV